MFNETAFLFIILFMWHLLDPKERRPASSLFYRKKLVSFTLKSRCLDTGKEAALLANEYIIGKGALAKIGGESPELPNSIWTSTIWRFFSDENRSLSEKT